MINRKDQKIMHQGREMLDASSCIEDWLDRRGTHRTPGCRTSYIAYPISRRVHCSGPLRGGGQKLRPTLCYFLLPGRLPGGSGAFLSLGARYLFFHCPPC